MIIKLDDIKLLPVAYLEGAYAYMDNLTLDTNPYERDSPAWLWWRKGWFGA